MFKKIEIWILYLTIVLSIICIVFFGFLVRQELVNPKKTGFFPEAALFIAEIPINLRKMYAVLKAEPFEIKDGRHADKPRFKRFIVTNRNELLLLARYDKDSKRNIVEIVDLNNFSILHTYKPDINEINSRTDISREEFKHLLRGSAPNTYQMRHPLLLSNGDLLFQNSSPLIKIDYCSNLKWVNDADNFHHANSIDHDENYWVIAHKFPFSIDKNLVGIKFDGFFDDAITKISPDGKILYQKSVAEILIENNYKWLIFGRYHFSKDPIHLNDIEPVLKDGLYWKKGDVFLSLHRLSMIMHFRPSTNKIINIITGPFFAQHDVDVISDKEISIFNNNTFKTVEREEILTNSEIVIYNFESQKFSKKFENSIRINKVKTLTQGLSDTLQDGSMMVDEQNYGRILFFNSTGELEWEFVNRANNGKIYFTTWSRIIKDKDLIQNIRRKIKSTKCIN